MPKIGGTWIVSGLSGVTSTNGERRADDVAEAGGRALARGAAAERKGRVEADEAGALAVARVLIGRRVAVEVPARERRGERPAERVAAADQLALAALLAGEAGGDHRVPVLHRPGEPELAQERRRRSRS